MNWTSSLQAKDYSWMSFLPFFTDGAWLCYMYSVGFLTAQHSEETDVLLSLAAYNSDADSWGVWILVQKLLMSVFSQLLTIISGYED